MNHTGCLLSVLLMVANKRLRVVFLPKKTTGHDALPHGLNLIKYKNHGVIFRLPMVSSRKRMQILRMPMGRLPKIKTEAPKKNNCKFCKTTVPLHRSDPLEDFRRNVKQKHLYFLLLDLSPWHPERTAAREEHHPLIATRDSKIQLF